MSLERLKWAAIISFVVSTLLLIGGGYVAKDQLPPYPGTVVDERGKPLFVQADIFEGQNVYQRYGLMDHGSVWGHGSQRGPEFSAYTLHLVSDSIRNDLAQKDYCKDYAALESLEKEIIDVKLKKEIRTNRYDPKNEVLVLTAPQVQALEKVTRFWEDTFHRGEPHYGFLPNTIPTEEERLQLGRFFFWTSWVASTTRPGTDYSYTNNWPADRSIGNVPPTGVYLWSLGGLIALLVVFGFLINLPIVNYYEHGTYLTMNHGHGALFGVYGMLSIGLLLFSWRGLVDRASWNDRLLKVSFFGFNVGLFLLTLGTLFPVGIYQTWISYRDGLWMARDASFFARDLVHFIGTVRVVPDLLIILVGVVPLLIFLVKTYPKLKAVEIKEGESVWERLGIEL